MMYYNPERELFVAQQYQTLSHAIQQPELIQSQVPRLVVVQLELRLMTLNHMTLSSLSHVGLT
jgi:hypothetical protein